MSYILIDLTISAGADDSSSATTEKSQTFYQALYIAFCSLVRKHDFLRRAARKDK